ncbi:MAG: bifunctional 5,10-methylenetetrahydrofolate dehydrogenase/5,10-methenyltetrahydrofolate cyclohydrolase [SAR324 cluster bacterium]|jgi:methylenetetrahydrofolate dehydrogenase (NADP+)/methenyltetrahydrofolate cyclohydrolase|nr:bifunctional 5,10-methylenetetrahydrofolate dehydrogenase/5,10-methenyltetrahydrofolate cyclohydrolase [SAR324 cluster bacterium]MDP6743382.1 bifunctional 5,10-methylenetetrahydrofolate dehydrogenase/5,10-methenyltetrahydrofolate cyclohydrolase [SAR324 cluster bacterium]MED5403719.1 bifunctional 5,10-methylenetetrahydrofolate dehydrogenase/5,10-methenyltetrahydrofolate cyclohydrolase [SAR324 cluster bacterium]
MSAKILDGREIAKDILEEESEKVSELKLSGWDPKLISIKVGENPAVDLYIRNQRQKAEQVGIIFEEKEYPKDISTNELQAAISNFNVDPKVTGIFLQRPVPESIPIKILQKAIHPLKDVEGMHPTSIGNIVYNELELGPCTAMASVELLRRTGQDLQGLDVVVIGHSEIVGKPIAFLLMAEGATVTVCHHMTKDVADHSRRADAVFVAVGKPNLITAGMLKSGTTLIDIGINRITNDQGKSKIVGDSDFESCSEKAGWITPVPGGVGPVTVSYLMRNSVSAARKLKSHYEAQFNYTIDSTY